MVDRADVERVLDTRPQPASDASGDAEFMARQLEAIAGDEGSPTAGRLQDAAEMIRTLSRALAESRAEENELELLREQIEAYHMAMDALGLAKRVSDDGRALSMYGRAFVSMTVFATQQRQAAINTAAELVHSIPVGSPRPAAFVAAQQQDSQPGEDT